MKLFVHFYSALLLIGLPAACKQQLPTEPVKDKAAESKAIPVPKVEPGPPEDPYFVVVPDTLATHGPGNITRSVLQDRTGRIWLASWEGIISYDGKVFTNHTLKDGLRKFHVFSILEDPSGNLWFGTIGGGVYRFDGRAFTLFNTISGLVDDAVLCMLADNMGNIWFGTSNGVSRFDGSNFTNFTTADGLASNNVNALLQDKTGNIWFGSFGGVNWYDGRSMTKFAPPSAQPFQNVRSLIEDRAGNAWIGSQDGLYRYDGKSLTRFSRNFAGCVFEDHTGTLWLSEGTPNGHDMSFSRYDGSTFVRLKSWRQVFGITEDKAGHIWFGTETGVCRYDGNTFAEFKG